MYALTLSADGHILSATYPRFAPKDAVFVETIPDDNIANYRYADGEYVYEPLPEADPTKEQKILDLKGKLRDTDYHILKIVEGAATLLECADIIKQRAKWRKEINELKQGV